MILSAYCRLMQPCFYNQKRQIRNQMEWMRFDVSVEHELHSKRLVTINVINAFCSARVQKRPVRIWKLIFVFLSAVDTRGSRLQRNTAGDVKADTIFRAISHKLFGGCWKHRMATGFGREDSSRVDSHRRKEKRRAELKIQSCKPHFLKYICV